MKKTLLAAFGASVILAGCAGTMNMFSPAPKDGELAMPADYKAWPKFVTGIEKSSGHIRDIYINETGAKANKGDAFANGSSFVMEIYKANKDSAGKMTRGELEKVFVMSKGSGWGKSAPEGLGNGDWIYGAFAGSGQALSPDYATCRGCHLPLADKDYVFHYDKYFDTRASLNAPSYAEMMSSHAGLVAVNETDVKVASSTLR